MGVTKLSRLFVSITISSLKVIIAEHWCGGGWWRSVYGGQLVRERHRICQLGSIVPGQRCVICRDDAGNFDEFEKVSSIFMLHVSFHSILD